MKGTDENQFLFTWFSSLLRYEKLSVAFAMEVDLFLFFVFAFLAVPNLVKLVVKSHGFARVHIV